MSALPREAAEKRTFSNHRLVLNADSGTAANKCTVARVIRRATGLVGRLGALRLRLGTGRLKDWCPGKMRPVSQLAPTTLACIRAAPRHRPASTLRRFSS